MAAKKPDWTVKNGILWRKFGIRRVKNMWIKRLHNHKVWNFAIAFWVRKLFGNLLSQCVSPSRNTNPDKFWGDLAMDQHPTQEEYTSLFFCNLESAFYWKAQYCSQRLKVSYVIISAFFCSCRFKKFSVLMNKFVILNVSLMLFFCSVLETYQL